jgi:hypothetical protein
MDIHPFTDEVRLFIRDIELDVEVTIPIFSTMPFSSELDTHTSLDSSGNSDILRDGFFDGPFSMTDMTFFGYTFPFSTTFITYTHLLHDPEDRLCTVGDSSRASTFFTGFHIMSILTT